jgi:uncharacterized repeat protein (TIGR01451 family)
MRNWGPAVLAMLGSLLLLAGCGSGSGRSGTDLAVSGSGPDTLVNGGDAVSFTMTVANRGEYEARGLTLRNGTLQISQSGLVIACEAQGGATCPATTGATMSVDSLGRGAALVFTVSGTVNPGASGTISNTLSVSSETTDTDSRNNSATVSASAASNDVSVVASAPPGPLLLGDASFTMLVSNAGPDTARDVVLSTTVSANLAFSASSILCTPAGGASSAVPGSDGTWSVAEMPSGSSLSCAVPVVVAVGTSGTTAVSMTAAVVGDARTGNNTGTASVSATRVHNLVVAGTVAAPTVAGGGSTTFSMTVDNLGPASAETVTLTNTPGTDLALGGAIDCNVTGGASPPVPSVDGTLVSAVVPVGGRVSCTVPVVVAAGANGTLGNTFAANAAGEQFPANNSATVTLRAVSSNLGVSQTAAAAKVAAGSPVSFTARVANPGPGAATNLRIQWSAVVPAGVVFDPPTCTPVGGATCPDTLGADMTVPSLGAGRALIFVFSTTPGSEVRGSIASTVMVSASEDQDTSNNSADASTQVIDGRSGSYKAFGADGVEYDLAIDFDAGSYTLSGGGGTATRSFTADAAGGGWTVSGAERFRVATDLIVGGHDFGNGVLPFVAARRFVGNVAALGGSYVMTSRLIDAAGNATTQPGTAFVSGNTLSFCENPSAQVTTVRLCTTEARRDFVGLVQSGNLYTATAADGESFSFYMANVGAARLLLSTHPAADGARRLRLALLDASAGIAFGPPQQGASTRGDWVTATLSDGIPVLYSAIGASTTDSASMVAVTNSGAGPFAMLNGTSTAFNGSIYLIQSFPVQIVIGGPVLFSAASGLMQITLP